MEYLDFVIYKKEIEKNSKTQDEGIAYFVNKIVGKSNNLGLQNKRIKTVDINDGDDRIEIKFGFVYEQ